jgi:hypothetical protein
MEGRKDSTMKHMGIYWAAVLVFLAIGVELILIGRDAEHGYLHIAIGVVMLGIAAVATIRMGRIHLRK